MILANLTKALRTQNWFAVTLEFLIVIAGVVIGFQITSWNEERAEREVGREYIVRLQEELQANITQMENQLLFAAWLRSHTIGALDALQNDPASLDVEFIVDAYIAAHGVGARIQSDTFDELISTGAFRTIPDPDVRQQLLRFYRMAEFSENILIAEASYQSALRRSMPHPTIARLREACSGVFVTDQQGTGAFSAPDSCPPALNDREVAETIESLVAANLVPDLREALSQIEVKTSRFERVALAATDALAALERMNS